MNQEIQNSIETLRVRFQGHMYRHPTVQWQQVQKKLEAAPEKIRTLKKMDETGGEPDVIGYDSNTDTYTFCDCSAESPAGRRSLCYDEQALKTRKEHKPRGSAIEWATEMGVELLSEEEYRALQEIETVDTKTSSWLQTPSAIRKLGGALFADRRYNTVFVYHNGAESYYAARGFRGQVKV